MEFGDFKLNCNGKKEVLNNAKHGVRKEQVDQKFHNLFDAYDVNGNGTLENEELGGIFKGLTKFAGADKTLDATENKQIANLFANQAGIEDADFMGFVRSISKATEDIVDSKTTPTADGGREVTTTYKDGTVETISYYPDGEYKFKKIDQEGSTTTNYYTIGDNLDKHYTATEIESRVKKAYQQRVAQVKANPEKNKPVEIIPNYEQFKQEYMQRNKIYQGSDTKNFERHDFELSERGKQDVAVRDFVLSHYIESHKAAHDALESMGILDDVGAAINAGAGEVWNSIKNVWKGTDEEYQNFYELAKKFEPNYNKSLQLKGTQELAQKHPENYFRGEVGKIDADNGAKFQQVTEQYQNAQILQQRLDILSKAMREINMYQSEQDALTYAPAQSKGMNPTSHILKANNLLLEYFNGDNEAVNMILNGTIGNSEATIKAINGLKEDTEKLNKAVLDGKTFDQIQEDYKSQYKAMYGTDFVPDELTEKVMDAKATGGMVKLAAITAISVLITKSPIMTQMMGAAAGSAEATGAAANMIRTLTARYGATAVQQGIKFAMTSGTLATDVGLTLLNQATSEQGVNSEELWESTKSSAKYIYFGSYIGAPLAQAVSKQLGKIGATARMFEGGVKTATGGIQTTTITGEKLVQNLMKGGNKVLTTGGAFLTDVAAFTGLEVTTEGQDLLTAGKEQTEMLGKLKIMNHFIEYMLGGKVHAGMSKTKMDAAIKKSGIQNWQIKEIKTPTKSLYEVQLEEGLPPIRFKDANELATAILERVAGNYKGSVPTETPKEPQSEVRTTPKVEISLGQRLKTANDRESFVAIRDEIEKLPNGEEKTRLMQEYLKKYNEWSADPARPNIRMEYKPLDPKTSIEDDLSIAQFNEMKDYIVTNELLPKTTRDLLLQDTNHFYTRADIDKLASMLKTQEDIDIANKLFNTKGSETKLARVIGNTLKISIQKFGVRDIIKVLKSKNARTLVLNKIAKNEYIKKTELETLLGEGVSFDKVIEHKFTDVVNLEYKTKDITLQEVDNIIEEYQTNTNIQKQINNQIPDGEAACINGEMYCRAGNTLVPIHLDKATFDRLFPVEERYNIKQGELGNCWFIAELGGYVTTPNGRAVLYSSFRQEGNDIIISFPRYDDIEIKFKNGNLNKLYPISIYKLNDKLMVGTSKAQVEACVGIKMLEQAYSFVRNNYDKNNTQIIANNKTFMNKQMQELDGSRCSCAGEVNALFKNCDVITQYYGLSFTFDSATSAKEGLEILEKELKTDPNIFGSVSFLNKVSINLDGLITGHQYRIVGYDSNTQIVKIVNPHDSSVYMDVPLEIFEAAGPSFTVYKINAPKILM